MLGLIRKVIVGGVLLLGALILFFLNDPTVKPSVPSPIEQAKVDGHWFDTISLAYLPTRKFDGRELKLDKILESNGAYTRYHITYFSGELKISGIMNIPNGPGPYPLLILSHGFIPPKIYTNGRGLKREQDYFARHGYAVIHPDYRNHAESDKDTLNAFRWGLGYVEDVINAVYAAKNSKLTKIDTNRIGMMGHSMGGGIAMCIMVTFPELIQAYVLYAPVSSDARDNFYRWTVKSPIADTLLTVFGKPEENPNFWDNISPITFFNRVKAPILINHGSIDESCKLEWSERTCDSLKALEKNVTLRIYPNEKHEFINLYPQVMENTVKFFDQYLKKTWAK